MIHFHRLTFVVLPINLDDIYLIPVQSCLYVGIGVGVLTSVYPPRPP